VEIIIQFHLIHCHLLYMFFNLLQGELFTIYTALPYVHKSGIYSLSMPNPANMGFSYYTFLILVMMSYIPSKLFSLIEVDIVRVGHGTECWSIEMAFYCFCASHPITNISSCATEYSMATAQIKGFFKKHMSSRILLSQTLKPFCFDWISSALTHYWLSRNLVGISKCFSPGCST
jgi:hypothetical protein